jgi:tRNA A-37 threonylcarbamoyl transferase component Bud32
MIKLIQLISEEMENISILPEYKQDFVNIVIKYINTYHPINIKFLDSSGSSIVILGSDIAHIYQYFMCLELYTRIYEIVSDIYYNSNISKEISIDDNEVILTYDLKKYIVRPYFFIRENKSICWSKLNTLNSFKNLKEFVCKNIEKLLWDISKGLCGIHLNGYVHCDATIDNIGINEYGNFVLFDFDSSVYITYNKNEYSDFRIFFRSLLLHTEDEMFKNFISEEDFIEGGMSIFKKLITNEKDIEYFEKLKIQY